MARVHNERDLGSQKGDGLGAREQQVKHNITSTAAIETREYYYNTNKVRINCNIVVT